MLALFAVLWFPCQQTSHNNTLSPRRSQPPGGSANSTFAGGNAKRSGGGGAGKRARQDAVDGLTEPGDHNGEYQPSRLERVATAATKQCLREHTLRLHAPQTVQGFTQALRGSEPEHAPPRVLLAVAGAPPLHQVLAISRRPTADAGLADGRPAQQQSTWLLVGPEGDWTPEELRLLVEGAGAEPVGLGSNRLRTETAAIALLAAASLLGS